MGKYWVKVKIVDIQEYIFQSNHLVENIGANEITSKKVFHVTMNNLLNRFFSGRFEELDTGGGGALLEFDDKTLAEDFIKRFSLDLLLRFPGLKTSFAIGKDLNKDEKFNFEDQIQNNKYAHSPNTTIFKHGITADCPLSSDAAEFPYDGKYISASSYSRIKQNPEPQKKDNPEDADVSVESGEQDESKVVIPENFTFTKEIGLLGQRTEASYIAVVHIDGNGMGDLLSQKRIKELKLHSEEIKKARNRAINSTIRILTEKMHLLEDDFAFKKEGGLRLLPIRPLMGGGDDITFVCEGRLGLFLAEHVVAEFTKGNDNLMQGACAGVAIVKTKFPFYKAYLLAEELCREAKKQARIKKGSYMSYYYASNTFSGSLQSIRNRTHITPEGKNLYFGPYIIDEIDNPKSLQKLKEGIKYFKVGKETEAQKIMKIPQNKIFYLREVLMEPETAQKLFLKELGELKMTLDGSGFNTDQDELWIGNNTPFFDRIELMDFYPSVLL